MWAQATSDAFQQLLSLYFRHGPFIPLPTIEVANVALQSDEHEILLSACSVAICFPRGNQEREASSIYD